MPYDHHTIPEYFLQLIFVILLCLCYVMIITPAATFFVNCHFIFCAGFSHLKMIFEEMDNLMCNRNTIKTDMDLCKIRMVDAIKQHIQVKKYKK